MTYDFELDRLDVGVRAIWRLWRKRQLDLLREVGVDWDVLDKALSPALTQFKWPCHEGHVFTILSLTPVVLPAAQELLRRYQEKYADSRTSFYERLQHALEVVPHSV